MSSSNTETLGAELDAVGGAEEKMLPDEGGVEAETAPKMLPDEAAELKLEANDGIGAELPGKSSMPRRSKDD